MNGRDCGADMVTNVGGGVAELGGPALEPAHHGSNRSTMNKAGAHYNVFHFDVGLDGESIDPVAGRAFLRELFPKGKATDENFVLFSTSGVHGTYVTIEEIEAGFKKSDGTHPEDEDDPEDWPGDLLTVLIVQPRIVCLRCGQIRVKPEDIKWLKKLRKSSRRAVRRIGYGPILKKR